MASSSNTGKDKEPIIPNQPAESLDLTSVNELLTRILYNQQEQERSLNEIKSRQASMELEISNVTSAAHGNSSPEVASVPPPTTTPDHQPGTIHQPNLSDPPDLSSAFNKPPGFSSAFNQSSSGFGVNHQPQSVPIDEVEKEMFRNFTADVNREPQNNPASGYGFQHQPHLYPYAARTGQIPPPVKTFSFSDQPPGFDASTPRQRAAQIRGVGKDFGSVTLNPGLNPGLNQGSWNPNQPPTRTAERDYGYSSGATVPNVTTEPRVPSAAPPPGHNFAGIPRAVQQNPFYHPQQTNGFSTQPPLSEDPPPTRRMDSQLPRRH